MTARSFRRRSGWHTLTGVALATVAVAAAGCATTAPSQTGGTSGEPNSTKINVVAGENFWGSLAAQIGGDHATVKSIITKPDTDPHDYEPTPDDGRTIAGAQYVIANGAGYDAWTDKLTQANPSPGRTELNIGQMLGAKDGDNPHLWYSPETVHRVIEQITSDYKKIDPADAAYFDQRKQQFETQALGRYTQLTNDIKAKYHDTPIGASESIVSPLADGLGLKLLTPDALLDAVSESKEPTAQDKATADDQIKTKQIKIYVFNSQNSSPDVQAQVNEAKAAGIPVVQVTETLTPANATFQDWQANQLQDIDNALAQATGH